MSTHQNLPTEFRNEDKEIGDLLAELNKDHFLLFFCHDKGQTCSHDANKHKHQNLPTESQREQRYWRPFGRGQQGSLPFSFSWILIGFGASTEKRKSAAKVRITFNLKSPKRLRGERFSLETFCYRKTQSSLICRLSWILKLSHYLHRGYRVVFASECRVKTKSHKQKFPKRFESLISI